jgi:hypothetical protein
MDHYASLGHRFSSSFSLWKYHMPFRDGALFYEIHLGALRLKFHDEMNQDQHFVFREYNREELPPTAVSKCRVISNNSWYV